MLNDKRTHFGPTERKRSKKMQWPKYRGVSPTHHHGLYTPILVLCVKQVT